MTTAKMRSHFDEQSAKFKVTYERRKLLGIITSWLEVSAERINGIRYSAMLDEEPEEVFINGVEYVKKP